MRWLRRRSPKPENNSEIKLVTRLSLAWTAALITSTYGIEIEIAWMTLNLVIALELKRQNY